MTTATHGIRDRLADELKLANVSPSTQRLYLWGVDRFLQALSKSPELATEGDVRAFLRGLQDTGTKAGGLKSHVAAIKFLYRRVLRQPDVVRDVPYPKVPKTLPTVLSGSEVAEVRADQRTVAPTTLVVSPA